MATDPVVAWLESPEGRQWTLWRVSPLLHHTAVILPMGAFSTGLDEANQGVHDPRHDPCGRGPIREATMPP